jgi:hypothetical protein
LWRIDAGKLKADKVREGYKAEKLRERDAKTLIEESKMPQLQRDFKRLSGSAFVQSSNIAIKENYWTTSIHQSGKRL